MRIIYERKNRISTSFSVQNPVFVIYCQKFKTAENIWLAPKLRHSPTLSLLLSRFVFHSSREPTRICAFKQSFVRTTQKRTPKGAPAWCGRRDLNPHGVTHRNLKPARLPVSPRPHMKTKIINFQFPFFSIFRFRLRVATLCHRLKDFLRFFRLL